MNGIPDWKLRRRRKNAFVNNNLLQTVLKSHGNGFLGLCEDAKINLE